MSEPRLFLSARNFQVWSYNVSHRQLLLRSTKSPAHPTRIDVLFKDVSFMCIETSFDQLTVTEISPDEADISLTSQTSAENRRIFQLRSGRSTGYVVAGFYFSEEDDGEYHDPSALLK